MPSERIKALSKEVFYELDPQGRITSADGGIERLLGVAFEELEGRHISSLYQDESRWDFIRKKCESGIAEEIPNVLLCGSYEEVAVDETLAAERDKTGRIVRYEGILRERDTHSQYSADLSYSRLLQMVLDRLPAAIAWKDTDLCYMGCNRSFLDLIGVRDFSWIIGKKDEDIFGEEEVERNTRGDIELLGGSVPRVSFVETVFINSTGEFRWFDVTKSTLRRSEDDTIGILSVFNDITTWVNAELDIQNRLWFEQQIMEISAGFINLSSDEIDKGMSRAMESVGTFVDADRCCVCRVDWGNMRAWITHEWCNEGTGSIMEKLDNFSLREMELFRRKLDRREIINMFSVEEYRIDSDYEREFIRQLGISSCAVIPMIKEGESSGFIILSCENRERSWDDDIISLLTVVSEIFVNVLDRQEMQTELMKLYSDMEERVREEVSRNMEQSRLLIQQSKLAAMGEMLGNIAHQWRQPLNALNLAFFELKYIRDAGELSEEKLGGIIKRVEKLVGQMSSTIDDFRNFFKENKEKQEFLVMDAVQQALSLLQSDFEENHISIDVQAERDLRTVGYPSEYSQVILNILSNSKDAFQSTGIDGAGISIRLFYENRMVVAEIEDNAGGIHDDIIDRIFEPYFTTKEEGQGTGIGLYMSKVIIEGSMGGFLRAKNTEKGALFRIELEGI
ncbi:PAS domain-containing sensor histidine kinase [Limisalsivibrio acetivorans]|uniref:PAS domain-containing sensor histidine kinase n=1 Tax=Limisalsivibrio acetivorans TaxID=1304888 RepID=UPI0003B36F99|nr:ATP-binding protein [Limisalsivibrio acetivorans]